MGDSVKQKLVVFCMPTVTKPYQVTLDSLEASIPVIEASGWDHKTVYEIGCPYISAARSKMLHKALVAGADKVVFLDHDLSWRPEDLLTLIETDGDVVCGTYRFKDDTVEYMGAPFMGENGGIICRESDGCVQMHSIPAGFLCVTKHAVNKFMDAYPELCYGELFARHVDLFNHGAMEGCWWGEDYAFAKRWREKCGDVWCIPDLNITHHKDDNAYPGNYHEYLKGLKHGDGSNDH